VCQQLARHPYGRLSFLGYTAIIGGVVHDAAFAVDPATAWGWFKPQTQNGGFAASSIEAKQYEAGKVLRARRCSRGSNKFCNLIAG
jgi:hypothetical protein